MSKIALEFGATSGFKFLLDLKKRGKAEAVEALEAILTRLKE
jgi:hypothetical protein